MAELRITTDATDPADLLAAYQDYSARYERVCDDIDSLDRQLRHVTDRAEGQRLTAELNALTEDSAVLLGWVAAAFAAYIFTSHGAELPHVDGDAIDSISPAFRPIDARPRAERRRASRSRR